MGGGGRNRILTAGPRTGKKNNNKTAYYFVSLHQQLITTHTHTICKEHIKYLPWLATNEKKKKSRVGRGLTRTHNTHNKREKYNSGGGGVVFVFVR